MLSSLVTRLRRYASRKRTGPYQLNYSDAAFFDFLAQGAKLPEALKEATSEFSCGRLTDARRKVVLHFRRRVEPQFFIDLREIPKLAGEIREKYPAWHAAQTHKIEQDCNVGLAVYSAVAPPLRPGFPWHAPVRQHVDDLLYSVRPHRFAFAPRMASVGMFEPSIVDGLQAIIGDWLKFAQLGDSNLPYVSNLVVIQRLLALCWTWAFVAARPMEGDADDLALEWSLIKIMRVDAAYLIPRLGTSYANNHLLVDRFAGWFLALWLPEFCGDEISENETKWLQELNRQTLADGTGFEHSVHYHEFGCEMALAYFLLSVKNGRDIPAWFTERFSRMLNFQADLGGVHGLAPAIGNTTEDPLFPLDASEGGAAAAWWAIHRELFAAERAPLISTDHPCVERAIWLLGKDLSQTTVAQSAISSNFHAYPDGGFFVFSEVDQSNRLIFRSGPVPEMNISAGHMHADLLSLYLTIDAAPVLVDAGTYTYRNAPDKGTSAGVNWRRYLAGPLAHNGPAIGNIDPYGAFSGDFRPPEQSTRAKITRQVNQTAACWVEACIIATHQYNGITRGVVFIPGQYFLVYDTLPPSNTQRDVSFGFQFAAASTVTANTGLVSGDTNGLPWEIIAGPGLRLAPLLHGSVNPLGGWISTGYGRLAPAPQVRFINDGSRLSTVFLIRAGKQTKQGESPRIEAGDSTNGSFALRISSGNTIDYFIIQPSRRVDPKHCWGIDFDGDLLWLRTYDSRAQSLRWLDGRSVKCQDMGVRVEASLPLPNLELDARTPWASLPNGLVHCELG